MWPGFRFCLFSLQPLYSGGVFKISPEAFGDRKWFVLRFLCLLCYHAQFAVQNRRCPYGYDLFSLYRYPAMFYALNPLGRFMFNKIG